MRQQPKAETFPAARVPGRQQSKAQTFPATRVPGRGQPMRRLFTTRQLQASGVTRSSLNWHVKKGRLTRVITSVYAEGPSKPSAIDRARATVLVTNGVASGCLAGLLLGFDDIRLNGPYVTVDPGRSNRRAGIQRREVPPERVVTVQGVPCTDALFTLVDLAAIVRDDVWERALESALRRGLVTIGQLERSASGSQRGAARMRRVLALRPEGAPPTESLLETRMVQLARTIPGLPPPQRQVEVRNAHDEFVARLDLAWPEFGLFIELDGQHHRDQPVYDSNRQTAVVAASGWLCGRFTWDEVTNHPRATARRLAGLVDQARRRPVARSERVACPQGA